MDTAAIIGITTVGTVYTVSLIFIIRKIIINKKSGIPLDRRLVALTISGGVVLILLILSLILSRYR